MGPINERIDVNTTVAVRTQSGFFFGTARWFHAHRLMIELDAELAPGEAAEVRVTLQPTPGTALLRGRVQRPLVTARGELPRYVVTIDEVAAEDTSRMQAWLSNIRARGTFSSFETISSSTTVNRPMGQTSSAEVRSALQRLSRRPGADSSQPSQPAEDPFGLRSDVTAAGSSRAAMRDALKKAVAAAPAAPPTLRPAPSPPVSSPPVSSQTWPPPAAPPTLRPAPPVTSPPAASPFAPRANSEPTYASATTRSAAWLEVRWETPAAFARDAGAMLANPLLLLPNLGQPLPDRDPVRVVLRHGDVCVECPASVKAHGDFGASYRLDLGEANRALLGAWLRDQA